MADKSSRYRRGFRPQLANEVTAELNRLTQTHMLARIAEAIAYHLSIVGLGAAVGLLTLTGPWWIVLPAYLTSLVLIARQQRGIELFVHDASHYAWNRRKRQWNDWLANLLVAWPTLSTIEDYRRFHSQHHAYYGVDGTDPCKRRLAMFGRIGLLGYIVDWYSQIGSKGRSLLVKWAAWHFVVYIVPLSEVFGATLGVPLWLAFWVAPMLTTLPTLRRIAESEEHDYDRADSEFATTYSNLGWIHAALIHPAGDAYHLLHHMWPNIPMRQHGRVHRLLMAQVPEYRDGLIRTAIRISD